MLCRALELEGDFQVGEVVTLNYTQAQVLAVEGELPPEVAVGDTGNDTTPLDKQGTTPLGDVQPKCLLEVWSSGAFCERWSQPGPSAYMSIGEVTPHLGGRDPYNQIIVK